MAASLLVSLLAEPAVANPPRRVWRDWLLVGITAPAIVLEGLLRDEITWRPISIVIITAISFTMLWRRTAPLAANAIAFGAVVMLDQLARAFGEPPVEIYASVFLLVLPYGLFRWGSGRHAAIGLGILPATMISSIITGSTNAGDIIGGAIVLLAPAVLGLEARHLIGSRERNLAEVKTNERALLARDLHDTVAHHVSAIAIRAQAGQIVGTTDPAAALDALAVIEREASKTLAEMRGIVGTLRDDDSAQFSPQPGLAEIANFASTTDGLDICVVLDERSDDVGPTVGAALYRVAQEAVTNARRHARGATAVTVRVDADTDHVRLLVTDDGRAVSTLPSTGFGVVGMTERAELLGGELRAGPQAAGGWQVCATIPRHGAST